MFLDSQRVVKLAMDRLSNQTQSKFEIEEDRDGRSKSTETREHAGTKS